MTAQQHGQAVTPPAGLAAWLLSHARQDALDGRPVPAWLTAYVRDLLDPAPMPASGHMFEPPEKIEISSTEMANRTGYSVRHIRRMCRAGQLTARRAGRDWLIKVEDMDGHDEGDTESR
ncbi:helix-turn-helix domain-containing protein [Streptosporangium sp. NPDC023963]|uniref:helix-turn-helix domain-containing protein n=1 Tax=Streptosporangium sp. NPDC023963 TaxID=3155608 RepID=UPI00342D540B